MPSYRHDFKEIGQTTTIIRDFGFDNENKKILDESTFSYDKFMNSN